MCPVEFAHKVIESLPGRGLLAEIEAEIFFQRNIFTFGIYAICFVVKAYQVKEHISFQTDSFTCENFPYSGVENRTIFPFEIFDEQIAIDDGVVHRPPDIIDDGFGSVGRVVVLSPFGAVGIIIGLCILLGKRFKGRERKIPAIQLGTAHIDVYACDCRIIAFGRKEHFVPVYFRFGADIEP